MKKQILTAIIATSFLICANTETVSAKDSLFSPFQRQLSTYYRTELYFGRSIPSGGSVSDTEWDKFLADIVTPRFPDGFTVFKAFGHYREQSGRIITEPSEVLVFLYPSNRRTSSRRKIEEIRRAYKTQFKQESVLRLDFRAPVWVSF
jgi:hypothetical protein